MGAVTGQVAVIVIRGAVGADAGILVDGVREIAHRLFHCGGLEDIAAVGDVFPLDPAQLIAVIGEADITVRV